MIAGTLRWTGLLLRTTWLQIVGSAALMVGLVYLTAGSMVDTYPDEVSRQGYAATLDGAVLSKAFLGRWHDLATYGGMTSNEMGIFVLLAFPMVALHLAIMTTRAQEVSGRLEVATSGQLGRLAPLVSGLTICVGWAALVGGGIWAVLVALGDDADGVARFSSAGALRYGAAVALFLLMFAAVGLLAAQVSATTQSAYGIGVGAVLVTFLWRALVDARDFDYGWLNPGAWLPATAPFGDVPAWPWISMGVAALVVLGLAALVQARRDLTGGLVQPRPGRLQAPGYVRGPVGLLVRLQGGSILVWAFGAGVAAFVFGMIAKALDDMQKEAGGGMLSRGSTDAMIAMIVQLNALFALAVVVTTASALASEERAGRFGWLNSTGTGRVRWWLSGAGLTIVAGLLVLAVSGVLCGAGLWLSRDDSEQFGIAFKATMQYAPAVVLLAGVALFLASLRPLLAALTWLVPAWSLVVTMLGDTLDLPAWARHLSPLEWMGQVPAEDWETTAALVQIGIGLVLVAASVLLLRRRSLVAG